MKAPYCKHARCFLLFIAICLVVAGFPVHRLEAQQTNLPPEIIAYADTVLYNGKILTADDGFNVVEAVAIRDGKFLAVGTTDRIVPMAGPNTRKIDLGGRTAMPGIIDLHQHPFTEGMMNYWDNKWLPEIPRRVYGQDWINAEEAVAGIKGAVERAKPGEMVMIPRTYVQEGIAGGGGKGKNFCELVTLAEIDAVSGDTPVFFLGIVNLSAFAVNSKAASLIQPFLPEGVAVFREEGKACLATGGDIWGKASPYGGREGEGGEKEAFRGREAMVQAVRFGWDVSADHTVGDRSVHEVLKAFEEGLNSQLVKRPNQHLTINHTPLVRLEDIQKMKELGVIASIGSWHILFPPMLEVALAHQGVERVHNMLPMKSYITMGLKPALEGDTFDYPTFWRHEKAITKKDDKYGRVWNPDEAVTRKEALWMTTNWPAYHLGEQDKLGTIAVGKLADLLVIDRDYMTVPEDEISEIQPVMTITGGKVVYEVEGGLK